MSESQKPLHILVTFEKEALTKQPTDESCFDKPECSFCCLSRRCRYCSSSVSSDWSKSDDEGSTGFTSVSGDSEAGRDVGGVGT